MTLATIFREVHETGTRVFEQAVIESALSDAVISRNLTEQFYGHALLGEALTRTGHVSDAALHYVQALECIHGRTDIAKYRDLLLHGRGYCALIRGELGHALTYLKEALQVADDGKHSCMAARIILTLSSVYAAAGIIEKAADYCKQGCFLSREQGYDLLLVRGLLHLSELLLRDQDTEEALQVAREAVTIAASVTDPIVRARTRLRLCTVLVELQHVEEAETLVSELTAELEPFSTSSLWGTLHLVRAKLAVIQLDSERALASCASAIDVFTAMNDPRLLSNALCVQAELALIIGDSRLAFRGLEHARSIATAQEDERSLLEIHELLSRTYASSQNVQAAYEHLCTAKTLADKLSKEDSKNHLHLLRVENEVQDKQRQLELYRLKTAQLEQELASSLMRVASHTQLLTSTYDSIRKITSQSDPYAVVRDLRIHLREAPVKEIDWTRFETEFHSIHPEFKLRLKERFPSLTKQEVKMCFLARLSFRTEDMATLLCLSPRTIDGHRNSLRKKLGLVPGAGLSDFLQQQIC